MPGDCAQGRDVRLCVDDLTPEGDLVSAGGQDDGAGHAGPIRSLLDGSAQRRWHTCGPWLVRSEMTTRLSPGSPAVSAASNALRLLTGGTVNRFWPAARTAAATSVIPVAAECSEGLDPPVWAAMSTDSRPPVRPATGSLLRSAGL